MEAKDAVRAAKDHVEDLFGDEGIAEVGLEEIEYQGDYWNITIGFSRNWDRSIGSILGGSSRSYKQLLVDDDTGQVRSVRDRNLANTVFTTTTT